MFKKRPSFILTIILILISCVITFFLDEDLHHRNSKNSTNAFSKILSPLEAENYKIDRLRGYRLIRPLLYTEQKEESPRFADIKTKLNTFIELLKSERNLMSASVYLKEFDHGEWMSINSEETYYPGSLIKVPGLITYLKMAESRQGFLDKKMIFIPPQKSVPGQTFNSKQIIPGKEYSVRELLKYMISYSDNNATYILNKNVDLKAFHQLFTDLGIPQLTKGNTTITARNFSLFLNVLFSATYLSKDDSEFAVELLEACDFRLGMVRGLPVNTMVAHKFGEMGDSTTRQLHESGLIYINNKPYLLTIMTKGYDIKDLSEIITTVTKLVYKELINRELN